MEGTKLFSKRLEGKDPERLAIVGDGRSCTYGDFHRGIRGLSHVLGGMGVESGTLTRTAFCTCRGASRT